MDKKIIIANFKAELTSGAVQAWLDAFSKEYKGAHQEDKIVILCPDFVHLTIFKWRIENEKLPVYLGAQDCSVHELGTHTGEIVAATLAGVVTHVILGHSERRHQFGENQEVIQQKINMALKYNIAPIVCAQKDETYTGDIFAVAYEPELAIGTGHADPPQQSYEVMRAIHHSVPAPHTIYGGSVAPDNVHEFAGAGFNGVLVGKKSLDPSLFIQIIKNA